MNISPLERLGNFLKHVQALTNQILSDARSRTRVLPYLFVNVLPY